MAMLLWDLLVVAAWILDLVALPRPRELQLSRHWWAPAALSTTSRIELRLHSGGRTLVQAEILDDVPPELRREPPSLTIEAPPGHVGRAFYDIEPSQRGDARMGKVFLRYQSRLQLAERWAEAGLDQTVRVYPNLAEAKRHAIYLIRSRQIDLEKRLKRQRGLGREFESLRAYRDGDEWRDICWTATARRSKLISKVYQVERSQAVWIVLDSGRLLRARIGKLTKLDYAVNAALSLAQVSLYSGDRVGLLAYGRQSFQRLAPTRGAPHLRALVEQLAQVRGEACEADHIRAAENLLQSQKRRSLVVWLTDLAETAAIPEVIEGALQLMPRHLVLFAVISHPELAQIVTNRPEDIPQMYKQVAALEIVERRELLLRGLRQRGALVVEIAPHRLSTALVNHYLEIKERSLL